MYKESEESVLNYSDTEYNNFFNEKQENILSINIPVGIDPALAKNLISKLDTEYAPLKIHHSHLLRQLNDIEKLLYVIEHKNRVGRNETDRKINGIIQAETYSYGEGDNKTTINLYKEQSKIYGRLKQIKGLIDIINKKISNIITISGLLKIEASLG
jgi:hypothetical protein